MNTLLIRDGRLRDWKALRDDCLGNNCLYGVGGFPDCSCFGEETMTPDQAEEIIKALHRTNTILFAILCALVVIAGGGIG